MQESYLKTELTQLDRFTSLKQLSRRDFGFPVDYRSYAILDAIAAYLGVTPTRLSTIIFEAALDDVRQHFAEIAPTLDLEDNFIEEFIQANELMDVSRRRLEAIRTSWRAIAEINQELREVVENVIHDDEETHVDS